MQLMTRLGRWTALVALLALPPAALRAQTPNALDKAVMNYTLTMPKVDAWVKANVEVARAMKARQGPPPDLSEHEAKTIEEMAAQFDAVPEMRRGIRKVGLSTKEFALLGLVVMQAQMYESIAKGNPAAKPPYNMNPANATFMKANKAALEQKMKEVQAAMRGG
jgi:hypothetical protein